MLAVTEATLLGDYGLLSKEEVELLVAAPYDVPCAVTNNHDIFTAMRLVRWGLLEQDPQTPSLFRCTSDGTALVVLFRTKGWVR